MEDNYKAGRQTNDVNIQFSKQCFNLKIMNHISKIHFIITREIIETQGYVVFITDTSSNGTFLNGEKIGKGCRWILSNNDKIAVVFKTNNGELYNYYFYLFKRIITSLHFFQYILLLINTQIIQIFHKKLKNNLLFMVY